MTEHDGDTEWGACVCGHVYPSGPVPAAGERAVVLDLDDPIYDGQTLPEVTEPYQHVHSTTGVCVKHPNGLFCDPVPAVPVGVQPARTWIEARSNAMTDNPQTGRSAVPVVQPEPAEERVRRHLVLPALYSWLHDTDEEWGGCADRGALERAAEAAFAVLDDHHARLVAPVVTDEQRAAMKAGLAAHPLAPAAPSVVHPEPGDRAKFEYVLMERDAITPVTPEEFTRGNVSPLAEPGDRAEVPEAAFTAARTAVGVLAYGNWGHAEAAVHAAAPHIAAAAVAAVRADLAAQIEALEGTGDAQAFRAGLRAAAAIVRGVS